MSTTTQQYTPGPWIAEPDGEFDFKVRSDDYGTICYRNCYPDESVDVFVEGDARLIAAAPDLLEAVQSVIDWNDSDKSIGGPYFDDALQRCREAVRKASGRESQ